MKPEKSIKVMGQVAGSETLHWYFSSSLEYPELALRDLTLPNGMVQDQLFESLLFQSEWYKTSCSSHCSLDQFYELCKIDESRGGFVAGRHISGFGVRKDIWHPGHHFAARWRPQNPFVWVSKSLKIRRHVSDLDPA